MVNWALAPTAQLTAFCLASQTAFCLASQMVHQMLVLKTGSSCAMQLADRMAPVCSVLSVCRLLLLLLSSLMASQTAPTAQ